MSWPPSPPGFPFLLLENFFPLGFLNAGQQYTLWHFLSWEASLIASISKCFVPEFLQVECPVFRENSQTAANWYPRLGSPPFVPFFPLNSIEPSLSAWQPSNEQSFILKRKLSLRTQLECFSLPAHFICYASFVVVSLSPDPYKSSALFQAETGDLLQGAGSPWLSIFPDSGLVPSPGKRSAGNRLILFCKEPN